MNTVSKRALIARLNRKLYRDDQVIKTSRGERMRQQVGEHYVIDVSMNAVIEHYGREYGCLAPQERLAA
jgi:hypothetical protein